MASNHVTTYWDGRVSHVMPTEFMWDSAFPIGTWNHCVGTWIGEHRTVPSVKLADLIISCQQCPGMCAHNILFVSVGMDASKQHSQSKFIAHYRSHDQLPVLVSWPSPPRGGLVCLLDILRPPLGHLPRSWQAPPIVLLHTATAISLACSGRGCIPYRMESNSALTAPVQAP